MEKKKLSRNASNTISFGNPLTTLHNAQNQDPIPHGAPAGVTPVRPVRRQGAKQYNSVVAFDI